MQTVIFFPEFFDEQKVQKNSIYMKKLFFVKLYISLMISKASFLTKSINLFQTYPFLQKY